MTEQLFKYLPHVPDPVKKKDKDSFKKLHCVDKQVLNLTGGLFPARLVDPTFQFARSAGPMQHWAHVPILQSNKSLGPIYSWCKQTQKSKLFIGQKFNAPVQVITPSQPQYSCITTQWPFEQTLYLCQLLKMYNLNFIVACDRYDFQGRQRTVEAIKEQYYEMSSQVLRLRGSKDHPLATYKYDRKYEENRKFEQEKYLLRSKDKNDEEKMIVEEIRKLDVMIKKEEREQISLKKALKFDEVVEEADSEFSKQFDVARLAQIQKPVYTRQQYLCRPLQLPAKVNTKLVEVMQGLNIPDKIVGNRANEELYDQLRKQVLLMFSAQRYLRKKEQEKKVLEDRKKKQVAREDADPERKKFPAVDNPKKKMPAR